MCKTVKTVVYVSLGLLKWPIQDTNWRYKWYVPGLVFIIIQSQKLCVRNAVEGRYGSVNKTL